MMATTNHTIQINDVKDPVSWNTFVRAATEGHLLQSWEWGAFKKALGWRVVRIAAMQDQTIAAGAQILFKQLPWLPLTVAYIPKGPLVNWDDTATTAQLLTAIHQTAQDNHAIFLKIEPNTLDNPHVHAYLQAQGFCATPETNQPRSTLIINLQQDEHTLLYNMRKKTRKIVRQSARKGLELRVGDSTHIPFLYKIMDRTSQRKGLSIHHQVFFEQAWRVLHQAGLAHLLLAQYEGQIVAAKMIGVFGDRTMHLWGGVSALGRDLGASYFIQWEATGWGKAQGYQTCDLWGIPDEVGALLKQDAALPKSRTDDLWGVYLFKRGFGGEVAYYVGAYDYVYRRLLYILGMKLLVRGRSVDQIAGWLENRFESTG